MARLRSYLQHLQHLHVRLLLALCLIGVGTTFGALALSGYYSPRTPHKQSKVVSNQPAGSQLVRTTPRLRFVAIEAQATKPVVTSHTIAQTTVQASSETLPWAKPKPPVDKSPPREVAVKSKERPNDAYSPAKDKRPQREAAPWPWNLLSN
ncbi:MAG TPA: hypothetical protein VFR73_00300 [Hyphomicrobiaceae bacterium]|nr:hypothetical protein [Hyphomicrobiaceae bacterium]